MQTVLEPVRTVPDPIHGSLRPWSGVHDLIRGDQPLGILKAWRTPPVCWRLVRADEWARATASE